MSFVTNTVIELSIYNMIKKDYPLKGWYFYFISFHVVYMDKNFTVYLVLRV